MSKPAAKVPETKSSKRKETTEDPRAKLSGYNDKIRTAFDEVMAKLEEADILGYQEAFTPGENGPLTWEWVFGETDVYFWVNPYARTADIEALGHFDHYDSDLPFRQAIAKLGRLLRQLQEDEYRKKNPQYVNPLTKIVEYKQMLEGGVECVLLMMEEAGIPRDWTDFEPLDEKGLTSWIWNKNQTCIRFGLSPRTDQVTLEATGLIKEQFSAIPCKQALQELKRLLELINKQ